VRAYTYIHTYIHIYIGAAQGRALMSRWILPRECRCATACIDAFISPATRHHVTTAACIDAFISPATPQQRQPAPDTDWLSTTTTAACIDAFISPATRHHGVSRRRTALPTSTPIRAFHMR
jgi:hypothetical protein